MRLRLFRSAPARPVYQPVPVQRLPRVAVGPMIDFEVHGESFHRDYIELLLSRYGREKFVTVLVAEPENPYDSNAVAVYVDGAPVGHLPRDVAPDWQPAIAAAAAEGFVVAGTGAIFGGTPDKPSLGIWGAAPGCGRGKPPKGCFDD